MAIQARDFQKLAIDPNGASATGILLAPYALTISAEPDVEIRLGRFSCGLIPSLVVTGAPGSPQRMSCGAFCEVSSSARIMVGGEHDNASLWNVSLGGASQAFRNLMDPADLVLGGMRPNRPVTLGDNVILSTGAIVVSGASIGEGTVIAAGAVASGACEPLSIYGGVPARKIKPRFEPAMAELYRAARLPAVHAHHVPRLPRLLKALGEGRLSLADYLEEVSFLSAEPRLHFSARISTLGGVQDLVLRQATVGGEPVDPATFDRIKAYVIQRGPEIDWTPDIFHSLGFC